MSAFQRTAGQLARLARAGSLVNPEDLRLAHLLTNRLTTLERARARGELAATRDLRALDSLGAVQGGAGDLWFVGRWAVTSAASAIRRDVRAAKIVPQ